MERNKPRVTVKERILVHLLDYERYADAVEVPLSMTQKGMALVIGVPRSHIALTLGGMLEEDLVEVEKCRVVGEARRQNTYRLTHVGHLKSSKLKNFFEDMEVDVTSGGARIGRKTIREMRIEAPGTSLVKVLNSLDTDMALDMADVEGGIGIEEVDEPEQEKVSEGLASPEREVSVPPPPEGASPVPFRRVHCDRCKSTYALQFEGPASSYACPFCGYGPLVERVVVELPWAAPFLMFIGLVTVFASLLLTFLFEEGICLVYPLGSLFGFVLFLWGLSKVGRWEGAGRRGLYFSGSAFAVATVSLFGLLLEYYDWGPLSNVYLVCLPLLGVLMLPRPIPTRLRFVFSVSLAVLMVLLGLGLAFGVEMQNWDGYYSAIWVCFGLCFLLLAFALRGKVEIEYWPLVLFSTGLFILGVLALIIFSSGEGLTFMETAAMVAWAILAVTLLSSFSEKANWSERVVGGVRHGAAFSLGLGFVFFGAILLKVGKAMEGLVELAIGLPLIWYGAKDAIGHLLPSRLYIIVLLSVVEMTTILALLWP